MTCQEVIELMQRSLDHDLDEAEDETLQRHLQICPECNEMFSRLQRLSNDLEKLPKVVPPFSIVDSILPRLEQIELTHREEGAAVEQGGTANLTDYLNHRPGGRKSSRISWKWAGGVVAAGLVLGIFLTYHQPGKMKNADGLLMDTAREQSSAASAGSASAVPKKTVPQESAKSSSPAANKESAAMKEPAKLTPDNGTQAAIGSSAGVIDPNTLQKIKVQDQYGEDITSNHAGEVSALGDSSVTDGAKAKAASPAAPKPDVGPQEGANSGQTDANFQRYGFAADSAAVQPSPAASDQAAAAERSASGVTTPPTDSASAVGSATPGSGSAASQREIAPIAPQQEATGEQPGQESTAPIPNTQAPASPEGASAMSIMAAPSTAPAREPSSVGGDGSAPSAKSGAAPQQKVSGANAPMLAAPPANEEQNQPSTDSSAASAPADQTNEPKLTAQTVPPGGDLTSPDGRYAASVEDQRVIVKGAADGQLVYTSIFQWAGQDAIILVGWSDSSHLEYEVKFKAGSKRMSISVSDKTETTLSK